MIHRSYLLVEDFLMCVWKMHWKAEVQRRIPSHGRWRVLGGAWMIYPGRVMLSKEEDECVEKKEQGIKSGRYPS